MKREKLFEPGKIGTLELKNRIVMPAMGCSFAGNDGKATDEIIQYYEERARGGCGLIITEICRVDNETGVGTPCQLAATDLSVIPSFVRLAEAVHAHDAKIFVQLHHPGNQTMSRLIGGKQVVSASDVTSMTVGEKPRPLSTEEVQELIKKFIFGAYICKTAGIDGVEIHAAHGYLIDQFLSPHTNHRTDQYGGDLDGRMRILVEIIRGIQAVCGPKYPISVRIDGSEYLPDGIDKAMGIEIAKKLEALGVAALNVSCGTYETGYTIIEPNSFGEGWKKDLATDIRKEVSIPVIAVNALKHPEAAEKMLEEGVCDFVGIGRGQLADPQWSSKARAGKDDEIRKCIGCLECFRILNECRPLECTINPILGRERFWSERNLVKDGEGRRAAVIGGGPAGMQAAIVLGKRGFDVTLFEKNGELGGTALTATVPEHKEMLAEFIDTIKGEVDRAGVHVRLNTPADLETLRELDPEVVFLATGGTPLIPSLPGIEKAVPAEEVLNRAEKPKGRKIAVIGGGVTGMETAELLAADNEVHLIEMMDEIGTTLSASANKVLQKSILDRGAGIHTGKILTEVQEDAVLLKDRKTGKICELPADMVILAMGVRPQRPLDEELHQTFEHVIRIGDANRPGMIRNALYAGYDKAFMYGAQ